MKTAALLLVLASIGTAQEMPRWNKPWAVSVIAVGASKALDIASTRYSIAQGGIETNPLYGGSISTREYVIAAGLTAGIILIQKKIIADHPHSKAAKVFTVFNFGVAGLNSGVAVRNWRQ